MKHTPSVMELSPTKTISTKMLKESGLDGMGLEFRPMQNALVIISDEMEVMELIHTIESLRKLADELIDTLGERCGQCDACGDPQHCWADHTNAPAIELPDAILKEAGIPKGTKLICDIDEEEHSVTIWPDENEYDLTDIPKGILNEIKAKGICIGELYEKLLLGEIVYDSYED